MVAETNDPSMRPVPELVLSDRAFNCVLFGSSALVLGLVVLLGLGLAKGAMPAIEYFGLSSLTGREWDPVRNEYGALPFVWGTFYSSALALLMAVPVGLGTAVYLARIAPPWIARPLGFTVELLAAVPSVVYGMWGIFVAVPVIREAQVWVTDRWGDFPVFEGPPLGIGLFAAGAILAIMILPFIASVARESIIAVPNTQSDAALALGATWWETMRGPVLKYARRGIIGGIILALGRALGETMAVTMLIGNTPRISVSVVRSAYTMSSVIANEFGEALEQLQLASLVNIALVLLVLTIAVNAVARLLIWGTAVRTAGETG